MRVQNGYDVVYVFFIEQVVLFWVFIECVVDVCVFFVVIVMEILVFNFGILSYVGFFFGIVDVIQENDNGVICFIIGLGNCFCISFMIIFYVIMDQFIN